MKQGQTKLKRMALITAACTLLGTSALALAQTQLEIENDGLTLSAFASSGKDVLSTSIRVTGPDGFVYEDRIEDAAVQWIPEGDLADGVYQWEVRTVTLESGAPAREITVPAQRKADTSQTAQQAEVNTEKNAKPAAKVEIPLERHFDDAYKNVTVESGSFRVSDGFMEPIRETDGARRAEDAVSVGASNEPGVLGTLAGAILDFVFPSAHAGDCVSPCFVETPDTTSAILLDADTDGDQGGPYLMDIFNTEGIFRLNDVFKVDTTAPVDSLYIDSSGRTGVGTAAPTQDLHIADGLPRIRIEDTTDAQSWYVKNSNAGRFEIGEGSGFSGAFVIKPGAPGSSVAIAGNGNVGIGTDTPSRRLHVAGNNIRIEQAFATWDFNPGSQGLWFSRATPNNDFGILKLQNDAPQNSIVATADGVGLGLDSPERQLHLRGDNAVFRMDRSQNSAAFLLVRTDASNNPLKTFVIGANAFGSDQGNFIINDLGTATSGEGARRMTINNNGSVDFEGQVRAPAFVTTSSRRFKSDINTISNPIDKVKRLRGVSFSWKDNNKRSLGVIAEEIENIYPELVQHDSSTGQALGVEYSALIGVLIEAIKEQQVRIDQLEAKWNEALPPQEEYFNLVNARM